MQGRGAARRSGGRSARVRSAVHAAVTELLADPDTELTVAAVAARAGVHATSVYRRWGTLEALVLDVAVARVSDASPMPDTGNLRADLLAYAHQAARDLAEPDGLAFLRAVISTPQATVETGPHPRPAPEAGFLAARGAQIQAMLDRAAGRGEPSLHYTDVLDVVLAPLYLRVLFGLDGINDTYLAGLVERLQPAGRAAGDRRSTPFQPAGGAAGSRRSTPPQP